MSYIRLFSEIIHSTIWREDNATRILWVTMLAMSDTEGRVGASIPGLADAARISIAECEASLARLMSPDPYSRTPDYEGRRIEAIEGGWRILNYPRYNNKKDDAESGAAFQRPTLEELIQFKNEIDFPSFDPQGFLDYYESKNWLVGGHQMKCWKAVVRTWKRRSQTKTKLFPIAGKTCSVKGCGMPAVYKRNGDYDTYYCGHHLPDKLKERYTF